MTNGSEAPKKSQLEVSAIAISAHGTLFGFLLGAAVSAHRQQTRRPLPRQDAITDHDLAVAVYNPFADFVKVPIQSTTGIQLGTHHEVGDSVNIEPVVPFSLNSELDLIALPSLTASYAPTPREQT
jgi:hypothetical protein